MRSFVTTILAVVVVGLGMYSLVQADVFTRPCEEPISYRLGNIDSQFDVGSSTVRDLLTDAEQVWESETQKDLFRHEPTTGDLVVNFVYDDRQQRTQARSEVASDLSDLADTHDGVTSNLQQKRDRYDQISDRYESLRNDYETNLDRFNEKVNRWEQRDSVPAEKRKELKNQRDRLNEVRGSLTATRDKLETLRQTINRLAEKSNQIARQYNQATETFADRFGSGREFNQATYKNSEIKVYQFKANSDLRLALTHEFGHALGIKHVSEPAAVMNRLMKEQTLTDVSLSPADQKALANVCSA